MYTLNRELHNHGVVKRVEWASCIVLKNAGFIFCLVVNKGYTIPWLGLYLRLVFLYINGLGLLKQVYDSILQRKTSLLNRTWLYIYVCIVL
jgi:hypothetical protein